MIQRGSTLLGGETRRMLIAQSFSRWSENNCTDFELVDFGYTDQEPGFNPEGSNVNVIAAAEDEASLARYFGRSPELLAVTLTSFAVQTGEIFDADIIFNAVRFDFQETDDQVSCRALRRQPYDLRNTLVHEIGHFLGFDHDEVDPDSTMYPSAMPCEVKKRDLTAGDIRGMCEVYRAGELSRACSPPAGGYETGGNPARFRDRCDLAMSDAPCSCREAKAPHPGTSLAVGALLVLGLGLRRRPRGRR